jgi:hypothetical protein
MKKGFGGSRRSSLRKKEETRCYEYGEVDHLVTAPTRRTSHLRKARARARMTRKARA